MTVDTVDVDNVELMKAGTWNASTGRVTVTPEDFTSAVQAYTDKLVDRPKIAVGHTDRRPGMRSNDGNPALGWVTNLRQGVDKDGVPTLLGDFRGIPAKLAARMRDAYRHRSAEVRYGVRTLAGKTYRMVFTGVALLGAQTPAIKTLDDVFDLYSDGLFESGAVVDHTAWIFTSGDTLTIRDPNPAGLDSGQEQPPAVLGGQVEYPAEVLSALGLDAGATDADVLAKIAAREAGTGASGAGAQTGLTPEQVQANANTADELERRRVAAAGGGGTDPNSQTALAAQQAAAGTPIAASGTTSGPALVTITQSVWDGVQAQLAQFSSIASVVAKAEKEKLLQTALDTTRITPDDVKEFSALYDENPTRCASILASLSPRVHTVPAGHGVIPGGGAFSAPDMTGELTDEAVAEHMATLGLTSSTAGGK